MMTTTTRERLRAMHLALQRLHKALLDAERIQYERAFGRVPNEFGVLMLAAEDPQFAWLKPLAALIVGIDEEYAGRDDLTEADLAAIGGEIRKLVTPDAVGTSFQRLYHDTLQAQPEVVMAHGALMRTLPPVPKKPEGDVAPQEG